MPTQKTANTFAHNEPQKTEIASLLADCAFKYVYTRDNPKSRENLRQLMSTLIGKKLRKAEPLVHYPVELLGTGNPRGCGAR